MPVVGASFVSYSLRASCSLLLGGALGAGVGAAILRVTPSMVPAGLLPTAVVPTFDIRVGVFCAVVAIALGVIFGLAPAWHARGVASSAQAMAGANRATTAQGGRLRALFVVGEVAAAVLLLVGAGLLLRTLLAVGNVPRGYGADSALTVFVDPLGGRYPTKEALLQFFDSIERETRSDTNVRSIAWASTLPMGESTFGATSFQVVGDPPLEENQRPTTDYQIVSALTSARSICRSSPVGRSLMPIPPMARWCALSTRRSFGGTSKGDHRSASVLPFKRRQACSRFDRSWA